MNISLNAEALCVDGPCGHLNHVVLKSANEEITHLVIKDANTRGVEYMVPINWLRESAHSQIRLGCTRAEMRSMPVFTKEEYISRAVFDYQVKPYLVVPHAVLPGPFIPIAVEHIPAGELAVKQGAAVEATDGPVGYVDEILMNPVDKCISHLILRKGHLWGQKDVTIPVEQIRRIDEDTVYLNISKSEVESLPTVPIHRFWTRK